MKLIESKEDWDWYKKELDVNAKYAHAHSGEPEKFPCKVESEWRDNPNGPFEYHHSFHYMQESTCEKCGHKEMKWLI